MKLIFKLWLAAELCCGMAWAGAMPDLVPMPKKYEALGGEFLVNGMPFYVAADNRQCEIGAQDVAEHVRELGGVPGEVRPAEGVQRPGIYIATVGDNVGVALVAELKLAITAEDPGPQGYIIEPAGNRLVIIGSDHVGALYGAMTLRQMLAAGGGTGRVVVATARVYDRPDYRYRSNMGVDRGFKPLAVGEKDDVAVYREAIDWMMRFKMNLLENYPNVQGLIRTPEKRDEWQRIAELNQYAAERGICPLLWENTRIGWGTYDENRPEFQNWDCVYNGAGKGGRYYCWSRDDLAREHIKRVVDFAHACHFKILCVHPVDGGGIYDPEAWSRRCKQCRRRFGNDRWKATVHQFNLWADYIKTHAPELIFTSPLYPYNAEYADFSRFNGINEELWRRNSLDYWKNIHAGLDERIIPMSWAARPQYMQIYRECFANRPIAIYAHSFINLGLFGTWHRLNGSNYSGNPEDIFLYAYYMDAYYKVLWLNQICDNEYAWNTAAPGSDVFKGLYYDAENDHAAPPEIINDWLPRACRAFFGVAVGDDMAKVYGAGILPRYIQDPGGALALANKNRQKPMADVDPETAAQGSENEKPFWPVMSDSPERMAAQVAALEKAWPALEHAYAARGTVSKYHRKIIMYFYKRVPLWMLIARARHACYLADELNKKGAHSEALAAIQKAFADYSNDLQRAETILKTTAAEPDLSMRGPLDPKDGDIKPKPAEVLKMLEDQQASLTIALKPRPAGEVVLIGLYRAGAPGAKSTKKFFEEFKNVRAEYIDTLALPVLDQYDCIFIFQTPSISERDFFENLPRYVGEGGRGVVFQHDLCGYRRSPFGQRTPFPQICRFADERHDATNLVVKLVHAALPGLKAGEMIWHTYYDHVTLQPGADGVVLLADAETGAPVVVGGEYKLGKVVFDGNVNLDSRDQESPLNGANAALARGVVEWFTGRKLER